MFAKYAASLALVIVVLSAGLSTLLFATRSQVLSGKTIAETWQLDFTLNAGSRDTYQITPEVESALENGITFATEGPVHVDSASLTVTPKDVYWTDGNAVISSTGGRLIAKVKWETPADTASGSRGVIFIDFPQVPGIDKYTPNLHSGGFQRDSRGRWMLREVAAYQSGGSLFLARFAVGLMAGIPLGAFLHSILWAFQLQRDRQLLGALLPTQGPQLPHTYYPSPVAEWSTWLIVLGIASFVASILAGFSIYNGYLSSFGVWFMVSIMGIGVALALVAFFHKRRNVLTVRVDDQGISYARGRGSLDWVTASWSDVLFVQDKPRFGSVDLAFKGGKKDLTLSSDIENVAGLRTFLLRFAKTT